VHIMRFPAPHAHHNAILRRTRGSELIGNF